MSRSPWRCRRASAMGVVCPGGEQGHCRLQHSRSRVISGQRQSRLFPDQGCALGDGGRDPWSVAGRYVPHRQGRRQIMAWTGLALLVLVGVGIVSTGLPAAVVLIAVAICGAILGVVAGAVDVATLGALPSRLINLLENDLLQALPLYVTMGLLLDRLPVADALYRASNAVLPRKPSAPLVSGMMLGALLGPMNGSVGASVLGLSRVVSPRLAAEGIPAPNRHAIVAVASTLGVLVPPSLVLILLSDAIALTGALFSLLVAATTFTMILRLLGTADLVGKMVTSIPGGEIVAVAVVLSVIAISAFVLDAFEIIFVIVPIVIPPLLIRIADARWVSVLVLLTLQSSFLLPPFGYALMMVRGVLKEPVAFRSFVRALAPFLAAQWLLLLLVLLFPQLTHLGQSSDDRSRIPSVPMSDEEYNKRLNDMIRLPEPE